MPQISISVEPSFEEVAQKIRSVNIKKATQEGLQALAFGVERYAKIAAPVDTGRMRSSIMTDLGDMRAVVAPHVNYAIFVHEGTRYMKATPFMSIGFSQAEAILFHGKSPFQAYLEKELNSKLH